MLMARAEDAESSEQNATDSFFVPSYLENSAYVQKLREAHEQHAQKVRDSKPSATNPIANKPSPFMSLPPGTHLGISHAVVERLPPNEEEQLGEDSPAPLPSKWSKSDMWLGLELLSDNLSIKYGGPKSPHERDHEAAAVRADHCMPRQCGLYYYEVQIMTGKREDTAVAVGFSTVGASLSRPVGWEPESWGYHGDDGRCFAGHNSGRQYGPTFTAGDVVGCGVNFRDGTAFFTRNGVRIATAFHDVGKMDVYPSISLKKPGEHIRANFGQAPFVYNIDDLMKEQRMRVQRKIDKTSPMSLAAGMGETELIQTLVLQFLQHDGYVETARAFAEDIKVQKQALALDPSMHIEGMSFKDDEDAHNRQRIRRAMLEGDVDKALKYTNAYYPQVLQDNEQVYFKLRCRKFIEMVRKAAQMSMASEQRKSNGHPMDTVSQEMDLDLNGNDSLSVEDAEAIRELRELEKDMLEYGQGLQAEYANDPRKEVMNALNEIWGLVAYKNPLKEPQVSHLLDRTGRVAVAEELNSAILLSLGKSSRAALETIYAQTTVLLEEMRTDGGDGAFVSIQDVMDQVPKPPRL
ncbi:concanavalin A-like lectin/glucanase domain-containing protein [Stachybotrys elegans]|uniref:Concanavalin A-like lectin/glucanase domain-containing protein n=1 Tax=Stachybotrys elegans TaxID=80388 RepID=A0A8K0T2P7_9HYPO|nr:concanavalin A-like lectin/glucanase domain-containing protein [Stachybotrys elegans]